MTRPATFARCFVNSLLISLACATFAWAQEPCATCGDDSPKFPDAATFLQEKGYPPEQYTVLMSWNESAHNGSGPMVTGYHVKPKDGKPTFDLYSDGADLLTDSQLHDLGIHPKRWGARPAKVDSEVNIGPSLALAAPAIVPMGIAKNLNAPARVDLPPVDLAKVLQEDAVAEGAQSKGPKRIGVFQTLDSPIHVAGAEVSRGTWEALPDGGRVWATQFVAPGAKGQRIHFSQLSIPEGGRVVVYNATIPSEVYGPYTRPYTGDTDLWASTCFSDTVTVECYVPNGVPLSDVRIDIDKTVYVYVGFDDVQWQKSAAGWCNLDASCYPEWATIAKGVGGIGTIGTSGYLWCTGTLLADNDPETNTPYFLTANHCVSNQSAASSIEVYWFYQTNGCGGIAASVYGVPRTSGGAYYLAGAPLSSGSDFAFLQLRNAPPSNTTFVGWSSLSQSIGTQVTSIHHPRGDYKRISFGVVTDNSSESNTMDVTWSAGTTEPGSSGSPLLGDDGQHIIGQLYGGGASCSSQSSPDFFGKFSLTYPVISMWLNAYKGRADMDKSGFVDALDVQLVINAALGLPLPSGYNADLDDSGNVDIMDVQLEIYSALGIVRI